MPIYAYRCTSCGHAKDVLQKVSDPVLTGCPACGAPTFAKQLTAAGFQLKGSGWYATDFKGGPSGSKPQNAQPDDAKPAGEAATTPAAGKAGKPEASPATGAGTESAAADPPHAAR
ncbi:MAG: zinc ribbon domain-containing protein [Burkholderiaceae bacterium]|nr:zinc ribbon domain-containing protein [Burkholderiaceae bacterium]